MKCLFIFAGLLLYAVTGFAGDAPTTPLPPMPTAFDPGRELPANDIYKIQDVQSGKMVEVKDGLDLFDHGSKVQQYENHGRVPACDGKNQEWLFIPAGEVNNQHVFYIVNNGFLKTLQGGERATVQDQGSTIDQRWMIIPSGDIYYIQSVATNQYLEIPNGVTDNSEWMTVGPYTGGQNQQFRFTKFVGLTGPQQEYTYGSWTTICSVMDRNKALNITGASPANGATIQLYDLDATAQNEQWRLERTADGYYKFISRLAPGKCIDVSGWEAANNSQLLSWDMADVEKQKWLIIPVARESGNYIFFNKVSGKCMDIAGAATANHSIIQTYSFLNGNNQKWILVPGH